MCCHLSYVKSFERRRRRMFSLLFLLIYIIASSEILWMMLDAYERRGSIGLKRAIVDQLISQVLPWCSLMIPTSHRQDVIWFVLNESPYVRSYPYTAQFFSFNTFWSRSGVPDPKGNKYVCRPSNYVCNVKYSRERRATAHSHADTLEDGHVNWLVPSRQCLIRRLDHGTLQHSFILRKGLYTHNMPVSGHNCSTMLSLWIPLTSPAPFSHLLVSSSNTLT